MYCWRSKYLNLCERIRDDEMMDLRIGCELARKFLCVFAELSARVLHPLIARAGSHIRITNRYISYIHKYATIRCCEASYNNEEFTKKKR